MADSTVEKLAAQVKAQIKRSTPDELVAWLAEWASMRKEVEKKSPDLYEAIFKLAVQELYFKTFTEKS